MMVGALSGGLCGFIGVYVVFRRIIFVSATLTQVSSFGVALAFYLQGVVAGAVSSLIDPFVFSIIFTLLASVFFALKKEFERISQEGIIGFGFLASSAAVILVGSKITQGAHKVDEILLGNAVVVDPNEIYIIPAMALVIGIIHFKFFKDFMFVSFNDEMVQLYKYPVKLLNILLFVTIGVVIAFSTRAIGALPVFGLLALPPLSALLLTERIKMVFILSTAFGITAAVTGYFFSFILSLPTGAMMTFVASIIFLISVLINKLKKQEI